MDAPLPWERLLWSGRPSRLARLSRSLARERYLLTDFRLIRVGQTESDELPLQDIGEVRCPRSRLDRVLRTSSIEVYARGRKTIVLHGVRRGPQLAALIELLSGEPHVALDEAAVRAAIAWEPRMATSGAREAIAAMAVIVVAIFGVAIGLHGKTPAIAYPADDAIYPNGEKRSRDAIVRFMETDVMPWARAMLGPLKGGADRVTCETCHGRNAVAREWRMPAVAALPAPLIKEQDWEHYSSGMDAQIRNAIYGYLAESDKQTKAAYMRELVVPGMSGLLHRPAYDFTKTYEYNRSRLAFGCYHCHRVK